MATSSFNALGAASIQGSHHLDENSPVLGPHLPGSRSAKPDYEHRNRHSSVTASAPTNQASRFACLAVAATAWAGLSFCPVEALAMQAYESGHDGVGKFPNTSNTPSMLSMAAINTAVDYANEDGYWDATSIDGLIAPLPSLTAPNDGIITPLIPRNGTKVASKASHMKCPQWTLSELEMVLPDFHGRPKPFPRQGHQYWPASFVIIKGINKDLDDSNKQQAFLQASFLEDGLSFADITPDKSSAPSVAAMNEEEAPAAGGPSAPPNGANSQPSSTIKGKRETCFSM